MKALQGALRWIVIIGVFLLPFVPWIVTSSMFFPYITGKNFTFRIIVETIGFAWLALALLDARYRPKRDWILAAFAVFIVVMALADAQGVNPFKSFWSNYERMDGWITIAHLFVYVVVASSVMTTETLWRRLFQLSLVVSLITSFLGFLQIMGVTVLGETSATGLSARIDTTFGNPIYLAIYMLFHIFIAALLWVQMWGAAHKGKRLWPSVFYGLVIVADCIAMLFTGTRGTDLGLVGGVIVTSLLIIFFGRTVRQVRNGAIGALVAVAVLGAGFWVMRDSPAIQSVGFLQRLASISLTDDTIHARFLNMSIAWQGVKERPILGWGQENYAIVFDKYYDPRMYAQEEWFDRVHDIIFDWWIAGGTLGLLSYLSILGATLYALWRRTKAGAHAFTIGERSILTGLLAGYFIHNLTVFDNVTSYVLFGTVLGYIIWRSREAIGPRPLWEGGLVSAAPPFAVAACAIVGVGVIWWVNVPAYLANVTLLTALEPQQSLTTNLQLMEKAIGYGTFGTQEAREQLAQQAAQVASISSVDTATKQAFFQESVTQMLLQEKVSPLDARNPLFVGTVMDAYGDYGDAATALNQALALSPKKQAILFQIGMNEQALGQLGESEQTFKQAYELDTNDTQAALYYAAAAILNKDDATADALLQPLVESGQAAVQQIAAAYASRDEYAKIIPIWTLYIQKNPSDTQAYLTLAAAYYALGQKSQAIVVLQAGATANPSAASQFSQIIQQVKSGSVQM